MNRLWIIISRVGTILFTIGLAFLILSTLAQTVYNQSSFNSQTISSQQFQPLGTAYITNYNVYMVFPMQYGQEEMSPLNLYNITINSNVTLNMYIIDIHFSEIASPPQYQILPEQLNRTHFDNLLQTKSAMILWQGSVTNESIIYVPLKYGNITVFLYNPTNETAEIQYKVAFYHLFAPRTLSQQIAAVTIPVGLVFSAPMLNNAYKKIRKRFHRNKKRIGGPDRI